MMIWRWCYLGAALAVASMAEAQALALHLQPTGLEILASDTTASSESPGSAGPTNPSVGPVTGRPLPRFASLRKGEANVRHGPSLEEPVDWVFTREDMPLLITDESGQWRRVEDQDGEGGWVRFTYLSGLRTVIVDEDRLALRSRPEENAPEVALLEQNVIARLESCEVDWCRIRAGDYSGWAPKTSLWGADEGRE